MIDDDELVAVYAPRRSRSTRHSELSVLVLSDDEMVIVTATGYPEPLLELALEKIEQEVEGNVRFP